MNGRSQIQTKNRRPKHFHSSRQRTHLLAGGDTSITRAREDRRARASAVVKLAQTLPIPPPPLPYPVGRVARTNVSIPNPCLCDGEAWTAPPGISASSAHGTVAGSPDDRIASPPCLVQPRQYPYDERRPSGATTPTTHAARQRSDRLPDRTTVRRLCRICT